MLRLALTLCALTVPMAVIAQTHGHSPYAGLEGREIKSLSDTDLEDLRLGRGWGLALAAELNGVPGPAHLLELQAELGLDAGQVAAIEDLFEPPRVYRRAKLSENCPLWNRIERRPRSRIHPSSASVRCGLLRSTATNIEATQQRMLRSPANWAVRQTVFAIGFGRPSVMVASGRDRPALRRLGSKSLSVKCVSFGKRTRY